MKDPTYVKAEIDANPVWALAFWLSEVHNDSAPSGWGRYIPIAETLKDQPRPETMEAWRLCEQVLNPRR